MADPPRHPATGDDTGAVPDRGPHPGAPRWVKLFGIVGIVLVLLFALILLTGRGNHGPGRHFPDRDTPSGDAGAPTPPGDGRR